VLFVAGLAIPQGCGSGAGSHPKASAAPVSAAQSPSPESEAGASRLRAELAQAIAQRDAARSQLKVALAQQRELQARLDALTASTPMHPRAAASPQSARPQVFTNLSTSSSP